jgi:hypothetical protein
VSVKCTAYAPPRDSVRGRKSSSAPAEDEREEDAGRRVWLEALEEDPAPVPSDVQTAHFIRLSNRRPHANGRRDAYRPKQPGRLFYFLHI